MQSPVLAALICPLLLLVLAAFVSPSLRGVVASFGVSVVFCVVLCGGACYNKLQKQAPSSKNKLHAGACFETSSTMVLVNNVMELVNNFLELVNNGFPYLPGMRSRGVFSRAP